MYWQTMLDLVIHVHASSNSGCHAVLRTQSEAAEHLSPKELALGSFYILNKKI